MTTYVNRQNNQRNWIIKIALIVIVVVTSALFLIKSNQHNLTQQNYPPASETSTSVNNVNFVQNRLSHQTLDLTKNSTWKPNADMLPELTALLHLPPADPSYLHHHDHLDIYIHNQNIVVPAQIGLSSTVELPTHTHDPTGIIHVEASDTTFKPTLGLFFDVWGVFFTEKNIGGYTIDETNKLTVFVNGKQYQGDPRQLPLNQHDEILVTFGSESELPRPMLSKYVFPGED